MRFICFPYVIILLVGQIGCAPAYVHVNKSQDTAKPLQEPVLVQQAGNSRYRILPGDDLEIKLTYHPIRSEQVTVLADGWISLPLVNSIEAAGKTPDELASELANRYAKELQDPEVVVIVRESSGRVAYVGGEIKLPKVIPLNYPVTLQQAIISCGGLLPSAQEKYVLIIRTTPGALPQSLVIDLAMIRNGKTPDIMLEPFDIVHVPQTPIAKVGDFIDAYINRILPKNVTFPFIYELHDDGQR